MGLLFVARAREHIAAPPLADAQRGSIRSLLIGAAVLLVVFEILVQVFTAATTH
jgi:hypothetical protein